MRKLDYTISCNDSVLFNNRATFCVGTGRMNLALRHEYVKQLKKVQEDIGFSYIRGHGLFCDDMAIYNAYEQNAEEKVEYNFTYLDLVFDTYLTLGIKPFVELGFMPQKLASGDQTIFYWKGNVTPPSSYEKWAALITATVRHLLDRYGEAEVVTWPFEVWNEPNLTNFWKDADMDEYFKLYDMTSKAVKDCNPRIRVGGPAICGVDDERWLRLFLEHCSKEKIPLDFVTRHAYAAHPPERDGHYAYQKLNSPQEFMNELRESRRIIDSFPEYAGMEMHLTEFNTSYSPLCPVHDTNLNAAYIARLLSELGDVCASYSYWTFGDVFEEQGVAFTPFSGGFGLLANGMIPKPTYWAFRFFSEIGSNAIARDESFVLTKDGNGDIYGIAWNPVEDGDCSVMLRFTIDLQDGEYFFIKKILDENTCNPLKTWINMGSPPYPRTGQLELLRECAHPSVTTKRLQIINNTAELEMPMSPNALCYFKIERITPTADRGYHPEYIKGAR